jgi:hypothetical protein
MIFYRRLFLLEGLSRTRSLESVQDLNVRLGIQTKLHRVIFLTASSLIRSKEWLCPFFLLLLHHFGSHLPNLKHIKSCYRKFGLSEKHTTFEKIFLMVLTNQLIYLVNVKTTRKILSNYVCFSKIPNFNTNLDVQKNLLLFDAEDRKLK